MKIRFRTLLFLNFTHVRLITIDCELHFVNDFLYTVNKREEKEEKNERN